MNGAAAPATSGTSMLPVILARRALDKKANEGLAVLPEINQKVRASISIPLGQKASLPAADTRAHPAVS